MKPWIYCQNPFLFPTRNSYEVMLEISTFHRAVLKANDHHPLVSALFNEYDPLHNDFARKYGQWKATGADKKGKTQNMYELLKQSKRKLDEWEAYILIQYPKTSPEYRKFFPQGRTPFKVGSNNMRISAFEVLNLALDGEAALTAVKASVQDFYESLIEARGSQQQAMNQTGGGSIELERMRLELCSKMYGNLGNLVGIYHANPLTVEAFFDLKSIRRHDQLIYTGKINGKSIHEVFRKKLNPEEDRLSLTNTGSVPLTFYFSNKLSNEMFEGQSSITIKPLKKQKANPEQLGYTHERRHLQVRNNDASAGTWEVELM